MANRSKLMHSFIYSQSYISTSDKMPCPLIISIARWIKYSNATKLVQRWNFVLWNDGNAKYCWFEFLNICGIFMTCVCLLACKTGNLVWIYPETIHGWCWSLDNHWTLWGISDSEDVRLKGWLVPWVVDRWLRHGMPGCCHLACCHCMEEESKNIG